MTRDNSSPTPPSTPWPGLPILGGCVSLVQFRNCDKNSCLGHLGRPISAIFWEAWGRKGERGGGAVLDRPSWALGNETLKLSRLLPAMELGCLKLSWLDAAAKWFTRRE